MYQPGDLVYPTDLPRRFLCRVAEEESFRVTSGTSQILKLVPLEGPWPPGTLLIRPDVCVRPTAAQRTRGRSAPRGTNRRVPAPAPAASWHAA